MNTKKALVIGGGGFLGSHIADELSHRGYAVTVLDLSPSPWLKPDQRMVVADLMDSNALREAMQDVYCVYHCAGIADIAGAKQYPYQTINANVMGVVKVLEAAVEVGVTRFIFASTMYVYSQSGSFYRASKQAAEILIEAYAQQFGLEFTMLRYGSLYGPRAQTWNGIRKFVTQIIKEGQIDYSGDGSELREYIHVHDAARLSVDVLGSKHVNTAVTITGQQAVRVDQLFKILFEMTGAEFNVNFRGERSRADHYGQTPYRYTPRSAKKLVPTEFVDLGQGLLEVVEDVHVETEQHANP